MLTIFVICLLVGALITDDIRWVVASCALVLVGFIVSIWNEY